MSSSVVHDTTIGTVVLPQQYLNSSIVALNTSCQRNDSGLRAKLMLAMKTLIRKCDLLNGVEKGTGKKIRG